MCVCVCVCVCVVNNIVNIALCTRLVRMPGVVDYLKVNYETAYLYDPRHYSHVQVEGEVYPFPPRHTYWKTFELSAFQKFYVEFSSLMMLFSLIISLILN